MKRLIPFLFLLMVLPLAAQDHVSQQFLVQLKPETPMRYFMDEMAEWNGQATKLKIVRQVIPHMDIWLLEYGNKMIPEDALLEALANHPSVAIVQFNHKIQQRSAPQALNPNDPNYPIQWHFNNTGQNGGQVGLDVHAENAWNIATGGYTTVGDTIVIAVLDDGIQLNHPDLQANLWRNTAEIPSNGIDDDNNGYIDDYLGWNSHTLDDNIHLNGAGGHGTPVAGLIGASGNNSTGVTGVNWAVKMMIIRNDFDTNEANVLAAYGYALTQRKRYNQTGGAAGAYVVATNASWGLDNGQASQAPLWCAMYDSLGKAGIINIAATTNNSVNVDQVGDLPTTCPSDYLIAVGNMNRFGTYTGGRGTTHVDLVAPGDGCFSTSNGSNYSTFGGTSAASPHVAGAVGLVYAAACPQFIQLSKVYPDQAAQQVRQFILNGVSPMTVLNGVYATGGRLNLHWALLNTQNACPVDSCFAPGGLQLLSVNDSSAQLSWGNFFGDSLRLRLRRSGSSNWEDTLFANVVDTAVFTNLQLCTDYEVEIRGICSGNLGSAIFYSFQTEGCCLPPQGLSLVQSSDFSLTVGWQPQQLGQSYVLRWREYGASSWTVVNVNGSSQVLTGLQPCTFYDIQVLTNCTAASSIFTTRLIVSTTGCSSCSSQPVCSMLSTDSALDWIDRVTVGSFTKNSGNNGGYYLYDSSFIEVNAGSTVPFTVEQGDTYQEYLRIWADWNQDGDFSDANELLYEGEFSFVTTITDVLQVPTTAVAGVTRLRVALRWGNFPGLCSQYQNGEVEDYCMLVAPYTNVSNIAATADPIVVYPNPTNGNFQLKGMIAGRTQLELFDMAGKKCWQQQVEITGEQPLFELPSSLGNGLYILKIQNKQQAYTVKLSVLP